MLKIGLSGGIGSGKTTISDLFAELGVPVIDTDIIARNLTGQEKVLSDITASFGESVLDEDGKLDRKQFAQLVFQDDEARSRLEDILHPRIRDNVSHQIQEFCSQPTPPAYVLIVIPLLFESGFQDMVDRILVVTSDEATRIQRVCDRDGRSIEEIHSIMLQQISDDVRNTEADDIIVNDADKASLMAKVNKLHEIYLTVSERQA